MSFSGSDDLLMCDMCTMLCPGELIAPWPSTGRCPENGRVRADLKDTFHLCLSCLQKLVLKAPLPPGGRARALRSQGRWEARQDLLAEAEGIVRGRTA